MGRGAWVIAGMLSLLVGAPLAEAGPVTSAYLRAATTELSVPVGTRASFTVELVNNGSTNNTYDLTLRAARDSNPAVSPSDCTLRPGASCRIRVEADVLRAGRLNLTLRATRTVVSTDWSEIQLLAWGVASKNPVPPGAGRASLVLAESPRAASGDDWGWRPDAADHAGFLLALPGFLLLPGVRRRIGPWFALLSWTIRQRITEQPTRRRILDLVNRRPGIHRAELQRALEIGHGTLAYHLRELQLAGVLHCIHDGFRAHVLPTDRSPTQSELLAATEAAIERLARQRPGVPQATVSKELALGKRMTSYYVGRLVRRGLLRRIPQGRTHRLYATA